MMKKKKKVLIIHDSMAGGGAERVLSTLLNHIDRERFEITLLLIYRHGIFLDTLPQDLEVIGLFDNPGTNTQRLVNHFYGIRNYIRRNRARKLLKGRAFDVTVSFMEGPVVKLHSQLLDLAPRNLSWVHTNLKDYRWYGFWLNHEDERHFYKHIDKIAFISAEAKDVFKELFETDARLEVIYNPVDNKSVNAESTADYGAKDDAGTFKIITVGRLVPPKRQDRLIEAAAILKRKGLNFSLEIVGDGPLMNKLRGLSESLGVDDRINFAGFIANPFPLVKRADLFCLTSEAEGFGMVVAEALSLHTPVVSTRVTGVNEMLAHGGGLFTDDTPEDIADKIESLMTDPQRLKELRAEAAESAKQFNLDNVMKKIESYIDN